MDCGLIIIQDNIFNEQTATAVRKLPISHNLTNHILFISGPHKNAPLPIAGKMPEMFFNYREYLPFNAELMQHFQDFDTILCARDGTIKAFKKMI